VALLALQVMAILFGRTHCPAADPHRSSAKNDAGNRRTAMAGHPAHAWGPFGMADNGHPVVKGSKNALSQCVGLAAEVDIFDLPGE
jgi:hypothetical protein